MLWMTIGADSVLGLYCLEPKGALVPSSYTLSTGRRATGVVGPPTGMYFLDDNIPCTIY